MDEMLVKRTLKGDKDAFNQLVAKYQTRVYGLAVNILRNFSDAEDLAQEAFIRAYLSLHQLRDPAKFGAWLYRITQNLCRRWLQRKGNHEEVREYIRNLFWSLNDESGGIGWNAPQIIAETIVLIPELIEPYGSMLIDRTMEEPLLVKNGLWGIGRLGPTIRPAVEFFRDMTLQSFENDDPQTIGLAAWAMGTVGFLPAVALIDKLCDRNDPVLIYFNGGFHKKNLGEWARDASHNLTDSSAV